MRFNPSTPPPKNKQKQKQKQFPSAPPAKKLVPFWSLNEVVDPRCKIRLALRPTYREQAPSFAKIFGSNPSLDPLAKKKKTNKREHPLIQLQQLIITNPTNTIFLKVVCPVQPYVCQMLLPPKRRPKKISK